MIEELSKCPFCGYNAKIIKERISILKYVCVFNYVKCMQCDSKSGGYINKEEAINHWNKRVQVKELEK